MEVQTGADPRGRKWCGLKLLLLEDAIPSTFICPLAERVIRSPVVDPEDIQNRVVDREAFEAYQRRHGIRPFSGNKEPVKLVVLKRDKYEIDRWLQGHAELRLPTRPVHDIKQEGQAALPVGSVVGAGPAPTHGSQRLQREVPVPAVDREHTALYIKTKTIPSHFVCPITWRLIKELVTAKDDRSVFFERWALEDFVLENEFNPVTGCPMSVGDIRQSRFDQDSLDRWMEENTVHYKVYPAGNAQPEQADAAPSAAPVAADFIDLVSSEDEEEQRSQQQQAPAPAATSQQQQQQQQHGQQQQHPQHLQQQRHSQHERWQQQHEDGEVEQEGHAQDQVAPSNRKRTAGMKAGADRTPLPPRPPKRTATYRYTDAEEHIAATINAAAAAAEATPDSTMAATATAGPAAAPAPNEAVAAAAPAAALVGALAAAAGPQPLLSGHTRRSGRAGAAPHNDEAAARATEAVPGARGGHVDSGGGGSGGGGGGDGSGSRQGGEDEDSDATASDEEAPAGIGTRMSQRRQQAKRKKRNGGRGRRCAAEAPISAGGRVYRGRVKQNASRKVELLAVGTLLAKKGWYDAGCIFPAGYRSQARYRSSVTLGSTTLHTCEVVGEGGQFWPAPTFVVTAADRPNEPLVAKSCSGCWAAVLKRICKTIEERCAAGEDLGPPPKTAIPGPEYFGFNTPDICAAIEALDPDKKCALYWAGKEERKAARRGLPVPARGSAAAATATGGEAAAAVGAGAGPSRARRAPWAPRSGGGRGRGGDGSRGHRGGARRGSKRGRDKRSEEEDEEETEEETEEEDAEENEKATEQDDETDDMEIVE